MNDNRKLGTIIIGILVMFGVIVNFWEILGNIVIIVGCFTILSYFLNNLDSLKKRHSNIENEFVVNEEKQTPVYESVVDKIRLNIPNFNKEKFLDTARIKMVNLYKALKDENYLFIDNFVEEEFLEYLKKHKDILFEFGEVDFLTVHGRRIIDYRNNNSFSEIDIKLNAIHIDYMNNNIVDYHPNNKKYIENTYILTFKAPSYYIASENNNKCVNCGAIMKKDKGMSLYRCEYCGNTQVIEYGEWKISDIKIVD